MEGIEFNTEYENPNCGIYEILNLNNGHRYIGSSCVLDQRWRKHKWELSIKRHPSSILQRAWDKYGEGLFQFNKLITCHRDLLRNYEQQFLDQLHPEYNMNPTVDSRFGRPHTEHTKQILSAQKMGNKSRTGMRHTEESKQKISKAITEWHAQRRIKKLEEQSNG
jgi:group I intron endonuclease